MPRSTRPTGSWRSRSASSSGSEGYGLLTGHCPGVAARVEQGFLRMRAHRLKQALIGIRINMRNRTTGDVFEATDERECDIYVRNKRFGTRIEIMAEFAAAGVFFPGGIGTVLELLIYLQQSQLEHSLGHLNGRLKIILVGNGLLGTAARAVRDDGRRRHAG